MALIPREVILERMTLEVHDEEGACHLLKPDLSGNLVYVEHKINDKIGCVRRRPATLKYIQITITD